MKNVKELAHKYSDEFIKHRRHIHSNPELSWEEFETTAYIIEQLELLGIPYENDFCKTGVLGIIEGGSLGKTVALRADIDALPIQEKGFKSYTSKRDGVSHACGHDGHTAILLGCARVLSEMKDQISGKVLLIFQPAEEYVLKSGANEALKGGIFKNHRPEMIFGLHLCPDINEGEIGIRVGPISANSDNFKIVVNGKGSHAKDPHKGNDVIATTCSLVTQMQMIVSRVVKPIEPAVLTVGTFHAGTRYNVIPETAEITGTIRTFSSETRVLIKERLETLCKSSGELLGATCSLEYNQGYNSTMNDENACEVFKRAATEVFGKSGIVNMNPMMGGEDFSFFAKNFPSAYAFLGIDQLENYPTHNPAFDFKETVLEKGVCALSLAALTALE